MRVSRIHSGYVVVEKQASKDDIKHFFEYKRYF